MDLLKDEVLTDATLVCGTAWGNLKGTAMKAGYELTDEFQTLMKEDKRLVGALIHAQQ